MPTTKTRPDPLIPDHEVLRRIGGGSYGEVWLARGVTGALRAVKVLWREDFEDERSFEREFEGILKYEPLSRDHPGLVNVLHVGRSVAGAEFYYYVMELGDDIGRGTEINPVDYEARTLRSDILRSSGQGLGVDFCIEVGLSLARALKHLHGAGLAHRDVKPANVIFVNGKAKLADIGLVAVRGQRTFVGTEGFVPPEGPGSSQADMYSLGKVLYEALTGKDRLDFPELPDELPSGQDRKRWLAFNQVICEVCDPHLSRRTISTAGELVSALEQFEQGRLGRRRRRKKGTTIGVPVAMFLGAITMWGIWDIGREMRWADWVVTNGSSGNAGGVEVKPKRAFLKITSTPDGADVIDLGGGGIGELIGQTPTDVLEAYVGEEVSLRIVRDGHRPYYVTETIPKSAMDEPYTISAVLEVFAPPVEDEPWYDPFGQEFRPVGDGHVSVEWVQEESWKAFVEAKGMGTSGAQVIEIDQRGETRRVVVANPVLAAAYCDWLVEYAIGEGYLTEDHEALAQIATDFSSPKINKKARKNGWKPFKILVRRIPYGQVVVETDPRGADIFLKNGDNAGETDGPLLLEKIKPGEVVLTASLEGYKSKTRRITLKPRETRLLKLKLEEDRSVVFDREWENSLGMVFVPMEKGWMASAYETTRANYESYVEATGVVMPPPLDWHMAVDDDRWRQHPVVSVSREEAEQFCRWLTEKDRADERLKPSQMYRLPTDYEWSVMVGLDERRDVSPATRDLLKPRRYGWGPEWPPENDTANFADENAMTTSNRRIVGYLDEFPATAPVGSFEPNEFGIYDLYGNAQEWVSDAYSSQPDAQATGLLRGGSWQSYQKNTLYLGSRNPQPANAVNTSYGFRVVLAKNLLDNEVDQDEKIESNGND